MVLVKYVRLCTIVIIVILSFLNVSLVNASLLKFFEFNEAIGSTTFSDTQGNNDTYSTASVISSVNSNQLQVSNGSVEIDIPNDNQLLFNYDDSFCNMFWLEMTSRPSSTEYFYRFPYNATGSSEFVIRYDVLSNGVMEYKLNKDGVAEYKITTDAFPLNSRYLVSLSYNATNTVMQMFWNTTSKGTDTFDSTGTTAMFGSHWWNQFIASRDFTYNVDEIRWLDEPCSINNITDAINFNGSVSPPANDTTPPSITNINQDPANVTDINVFEQDLIINATITDNIQLNASSIILNFTVNATTIYINGSLQVSNKTIAYTSNASDVFNWSIDEHNILSATYNIDPDIMENTTHLNTTITGLNAWLKLQFLNVSNSRRQVFTEIWDENSTGTPSTAEYYYCNEDYTSGNPVSHNNCTLFFSGQNNRALNHTHGEGLSKHRLLPMGINTSNGELNGIYVTPTSYILKRGTVSGDRYFYVNIKSRANAIETSNNNGNTWTDQAYTVDSHIHMIGDSEGFQYQVCAEDNSSNKACSDWYGDFIDFSKLPPNAVNIFVPEVDESYNDTLVINHSVSFSASGQSITTYDYYWALENSSSWTSIGSNTHPGNTISWDISNRVNSAYKIMINVTDSLNLTSTTISGRFYIANEESLNTQLLTSINASLNNIEDVVELIPIIMLYLGVMGFGYWLVRTYNYWIGLPFLLTGSSFHFYFWQLWEGSSTLGLQAVGVAFGALTLGSVFMFIFLNRKIVKQ